MPVKKKLASTKKKRSKKRSKKDRKKIEFNIRCVPFMKKKGNTDLGVPSMFEGQKKIPMARKMRKKKRPQKNIQI